MGLRRSGKSSIQKVVFHKMSPNETLFLESTSKVIKNGNQSTQSTKILNNNNNKKILDISNSSFVQFQVWDFPGQIDFFDPAFDSEMIFGGCGAIVFVIDAQVCSLSRKKKQPTHSPPPQDDYIEALSKLHMTVTKAYKVNPDISFEVFIHKVDGLSDDHKIGICPCSMRTKNLVYFIYFAPLQRHNGTSSSGQRTSLRMPTSTRSTCHFT